MPIVDSNEIGDFKALGFQTVAMTQALPAEPEWRKMVARNRLVLRDLDGAFQSGAAALKRSLAAEKREP